MAGSTSRASPSFFWFRSLTPRKYDVFISFRGEDTRINFTSHLHDALSRNQIQTFIDHELHKGYEISPTLLRAIEDSYISVVVFSKNYATSKWCLDELVKIMECRKYQGQVVIPVFYNIDPSHVRKQIGSYNKAFEKHVQDFMPNLEKVQKWKDALTEAAGLAGCDSHSRSYRDDSELIQKIVIDILQKLNYHYPPNDLNGLIGIEKNCAPLESLLSEAQSVGIWGMGGIGKTTIAKAIFAKCTYQYEGSCFLENVRERSGKYGQGLPDLRNQLHSGLLQEKNWQNSAAKSTFVERRLRRQTNFIVLDDVSSSQQLKYLVGELQCYGPGSKIIITTRDKNVLESTRVEKIHKVEELDFQASLQLFCLNAFNEVNPQMGYLELSRRAVVYCKGVPLALIVLGSFLHSKRKNEWDSALKKLEKIPKEEIQNVLKLSYDGLNDEEKEIFLDIACFLKGESKEHIISLLDSCGFYAGIGLRSLQDKALINICGDLVSMHNLIQEMGWEIVRQESIKNPEQRSRLWDFDDTCDVLQNNTGTDAIEGIMLDMSQCRQHLQLSADTFKKMTRLRFLKFYASSSGKICNIYCPTGLESLPNKLRHLEWCEYPLQSLPSKFCPERIVNLRMPNSQFEKLWDGVQNLVHLKEVRLSGCQHLIELPDFSKAQNLKSVDLYDCRSLRHVHSSILSIGTLEYLNLCMCQKLEALESEIHLRSLSDLIVDGCSSLKKFSVSSEEIEYLNLTQTGVQILDSSIGRFSKVKGIFLDGLRLENLPNELSCLRSLEKLSLSNCGPIILERKLRLIFDGLQSLRGLYLQNCCHLYELPNNVSILSSLQELVLDGSGVMSLPKSIKHLSGLEILSLRGCRRLRSLPELPPSIRRLNALNCTLLETVAFSLTSQPQEQEYRNISFQNCMNLDRKEIIYSFHQYVRELAHRYEIRRRKGGRAKVWDGFINRFMFCYPENRVPEWFTYRTKGASITIELTPPSYDYFSSLLCVVLSPYHFPSTGFNLDIKCECYLDNGKMHKHATGTHFLRQVLTESNSDHVYISYHSDYCGRMLSEIEPDRVNTQCTSSSYYNPKVTFQFSVTGKQPSNSRGTKRNRVPQLANQNYDWLVKECGVYLIYPFDYHNLIEPMELELGMKTKRHRDILVLEPTESGIEVGSSGDQEPLPPTKKLKELC